jgi:23S rRNA (uracil1939-C5)-methyltransferase
VIDCAVTSLNHEGYGTSLVEGVPVLVRGVMPDELVRARITFVGRRETFAELVKVLRKSPVRVAKPACDKGAACDGCPLVQMQYHAQLAWKREMVERFIHGYPSLRSIPVHPVIPSDSPLGYRNSAKLVVAGKFADPVIGIYRPNSHDVVDIVSAAPQSSDQQGGDGGEGGDQRARYHYSSRTGSHPSILWSGF